MNTIKRPFKVTIASKILIIFGIFELFYTIFFRIPFVYELLSRPSALELNIVNYVVNGLVVVLSIVSIWIGYRIWKGKYWLKLMPRAIAIMTLILITGVLRMGDFLFIEFGLHIILFVIVFTVAYVLIKDEKHREYFKRYQTVELPKRLMKDYQLEYKLSIPLIIGGIILSIIGFLFVRNFISIDEGIDFLIEVMSFAIGLGLIAFGLIIRFLGKVSLEESIRKLKE